MSSLFAPKCGTGNIGMPSSTSVGIITYSELSQEGKHQQKNSPSRAIVGSVWEYNEG